MIKKRDKTVGVRNKCPKVIPDHRARRSDKTIIYNLENMLLVSSGRPNVASANIQPLRL
jgi:hypothetical protein